MAAGDDVCAWVPKDRCSEFVDFMKKNVAHHDKKLNICHGLGQIISDYRISPWYDLEFCSKLFIHARNGKTFEGWYIF